MNDRTKKALFSNSAINIYLILILSILITLRTPAFFGFGTVLTLSRAMLVTLIFALGEMVVIIAGGIDVSFPAIASLSLYSAVKLSLAYNINNLFVILLFVLVIGFIFGSINAYLIAYRNIPPLIATLGTSSVINGGTLAFLGVKQYANLAPSFVSLSKMNLITYKTPQGLTYSLNVLIIVPIVLLLVMAFILRKTKFGRSLYVVGGDRDAAAVLGFNVRAIRSFTYIFSGMMGALGGFIYMVLMNYANPQILMGTEMIVIASIVMGGTRITGGHGTILGTLLGVLLITLVQNNLVMLGVPPHFQTFIIGLIIVIGAIVPAVRSRLQDEKIGGTMWKNLLEI